MVCTTTVTMAFSKYQRRYYSFIFSNDGSGRPVLTFEEGAWEYKSVLFFFFSDMASSDSMVKLSLKREIAQLMREKDIKRARMSEVCADLVYHCKRHASEDYLLSCAKGSARKTAGNDPYKEGSSCKVMWSLDGVKTSGNCKNLRQSF